MTFTEKGRCQHHLKFSTMLVIRAVFIFIILFHFGKTSITGPVFITVPKRKVEFINTVGVKLDCAAHGNPDPKITWLRRNHNQELEEIKTIPSLLRLLNNGTIELLKFTPNQYRPDIHATVYLCTATNTHGKIVSSRISVRGTTEQQQQLLQAQVYDEYVIKGNTAVFTCHIPAFFKDDLEVIAWIREDNFSIKKSTHENNMRITQTGKLHIMAVSSSMDLSLGYWCQIRNKLTRKTFLSQTAGRIKLTEPHGGSPPTITDSIELVSMQRGETIELSCAAQANPPPSYIWKSKSESQVLSKSSILKLTLTEYGTSVYVCTVQNKFGSEKSETTIVVREPLKPFIHPNYQVLNSGSELKLSCNVKGHPIAKITWFFNGKILKDNDKVTYQKENVLKIFAVDGANEGMYQCFAENKWETAQTTAQVVLGDMPPILIRTFTSKKIQPGPSIILKCTAVGRPVPKFTWKVNGKDVRGDSDKFVIREENMKNGTVTGNIIVKSIRAQDGGEYTCLASNNINVTSHSGDVIVYGLPVVHLTENVTVAVGKDAVIRCYVSGFPIKVIKWHRVDRNRLMPIASSFSKSGVLHIKHTAKADQGFYACSADNGQGVISTEKIYLQVLVPPKITLYRPGSDVEEGDSVLFTCNVIKGDDPVTITWKKDNELIGFNHGVDVTSTKMYSLLQIRHTKNHHRGNYSCIVKNAAGVVLKSLQLNVKVSPKWIEKPNDKTVAAGRNVKLECKVKGDPSPRIKWVKIKNGTVIAIHNSSKYQVNQNGSFTIKVVDKEDQGKYRCIASNGVNPDIDHEIRLIVHDDLILSQQSKQYMVSPGNTAMLTCKAEAVGIVRFKWYHKDSEMAESERFNIMTKKLSKSLISMMEIRNISKMDVGKYTCEASNQHQKKKLITHLYLLHDMNTEVEDIKSDTNFKEPKFRNEAVPTTQIPIVLFITDIMKKEESVKKQTEKKREKDDTLVSDGTRQDAKFSEEFELPRQKPSRPKRKVNRLSYYFNSTFILVIPTVVVVILLIAVIITLVIFLVTKNSNRRKEQEKRNQEQEMYSRNVMKSNHLTTPRSTIDRSYGHVRISGKDSLLRNSAGFNAYEIPDYCDGNQPYSTLQFSRRNNSLPLQTNRESQCSV